MLIDYVLLTFGFVLFFYLVASNSCCATNFDWTILIGGINVIATMPAKSL